METAIAQINQAVQLVLPELVLLGTVCVILLTAPFLVSDSGEADPGLRHHWGVLSLLALGTALLIWFRTEPTAVSGGPFVADNLAWLARGMSLTGGMLLVLLLWNQIGDGRAAEAHACLLSIIAGTNLVASANDLVVLFLALELVSIPTYVFLYLPRHDAATKEATIKYFFLSVFSSAIVLYGMSWLYGATGTTNFSAIASVYQAAQPQTNVMVLRVSVALLVAGLSFRITAVPFHFYAPDVFQGVNSSSAAMLSFIPKVVGFVAIMRLLPLAGASESLAHWLPDSTTRTLLALLALVTMFVGNLMALRQSHLQRLMAYSSIAHAGYMLLGLTAGDGAVIGGQSAVLFYLAVYGLMTIGVFALLGGLRTSSTSTESRAESSGAESADQPIVFDSDLRGLSRLHPATALLLAVCLLSLTGLPPTAGFLGKLNLFLAAWSEGTLLGRGLAAALALNAAIAAWYYLRLIALMYLDPVASPEVRPIERMSWLAGAICAAATIVLFFAPQALIDAVVRAAG